MCVREKRGHEDHLLGVLAYFPAESLFAWRLKLLQRNCPYSVHLCLSLSRGEEETNAGWIGSPEPRLDWKANLRQPAL